MARKRKTASVFDVLVSFPWQVTVGLAVVVFVGLKWVVPALPITNPYLRAAGTGLSSMAWLFSGLLLVIGLFRLATQKRTAPVAVGSLSKPVGSARPVDSRSPPTWAPKEERHPGKPVNRGLLGEPLSPSERREPTFEHLVWSLDLLRQIEWKRFEDLCQKFYETKGI